MIQFKVDLNTKIISVDTRIFFARAGKDGHLFAQVVDEMAIGPDLPMLDLDIGKGLLNDTNLEAKVKRSRAISTWIRKSKSQRGPEPSKDLNYYQSAKKRNGHAQIEGIVKNYFHDLSGGDLLLVPNPSFLGDWIAAEVLPLGTSTYKIRGTNKYEGYDFDGRRLGYMRHIKARDIPRSLIDLSRAPTGFAEIRNTSVKRKIFDLCYDDFIFDDLISSKIKTSKSDFGPFDGNVLNALVTMVAKNADLIESGGDMTALLNLINAAFVQSANQELQVKIDIQSPGFMAILDKSIVPLVVGTVLSVLISCDFDSAAFAQDTVIEVTNGKTKEINSLCKDVGQVTQSMLRLLSNAEDEFKATCNLLRQAHENTGAKSNMIVENRR